MIGKLRFYYVLKTNYLLDLVQNYFRWKLQNILVAHEQSKFVHPRNNIYCFVNYENASKAVN